MRSSVRQRACRPRSPTGRWTDQSCNLLLQRIPNELAAEIGCDEALIVGPSSGKARPWRVAVERDGNGAFLGRGWLEFAAACGVGTGWILVLRHRGRGILTVKAFDASSCLREPAAPPAACRIISYPNNWNIEFQQCYLSS